MNYDKLWYDKLREQAKIDYKMYNKIDKEYFDKSSDKKLKYGLHIKFIIKNNKLEIQKDPKLIDTYNRIKSAQKFVESTLEYIKNNNYKSIDGEYLMIIGDSCDFYNNIPVMSYSKPKNVRGFLFPDFNLGHLEEKKEMFEKHCTNVSKTKKIYFKGNTTSKNNTKVREKLGPLSDSILDIDLNKKDYKPYYDICKYKYVLDIPGNYPWSVRLIELYLSKSLPFRINFYSDEKKDNKKYKYEQWIQFYELMFPENISYINFSYNNHFLKEISNDKVKIIKNDLINKFNYYEKNPEKYQEIVDSNYEKVKFFKMEHIYYYIYKMFRYYRKLII
jgi:hypothetical protein